MPCCRLVIYSPLSESLGKDFLIESEILIETSPSRLTDASYQLLGSSSRNNRSARLPGSHVDAAAQAGAQRAHRILFRPL